MFLTSALLLTMSLPKPSFSHTKQKLFGAVKSRHDQPLGPSFFELLPEIRDRIFYFAFKALRVHLIHWDEYPQPHKRPSWVPTTIECVPVLRLSKVHHCEVRRALLKYATIIVYSRDVVKKIENSPDLGPAIRRICVRPSVLKNPFCIHRFIHSMPSLASITFSICLLSTVGLRNESTWRLKPWAICNNGKCEKPRPSLFLQALQLPYERQPLEALDQIYMNIARWRKELGRKSEDNTDVAVELNIWLRVAGSRRVRFMLDRETGLRGCLKRCVWLGWKSVKANMDLREGVLRFEAAGHSYAISQRRDESTGDVTSMAVCWVLEDEST